MSTFQFLLLEDKLQDTEAIQAVLTDGGIDCELLRVDTRADFVRALETAQFDLLLAAYAMRGFDGIAALETARKIRPKIPFIFVSASLGEELAIEALKQGATDYVIKHRLERLVPCVQRALREAQERRERQRAEAALQQTAAELERQVQRFNAIASAVPDFIYTFDRSGRFTYSNQQLLNLLQKTSAEVIGKNFFDLEYPIDLATRLQNQIQQVIETHQLLKDETPFMSAKGAHVYEYIFVPLFDANGAVEAVAGVSRDITDRKQAEAALRQSEQRFRLMADAAPQIVWITDAEGRVEFFNKQWSDYTGIPYEPKLAAEIAANFVHPEDGARTMEAFAQARRSGSIFSVEHRVRSSTGAYRWFLVRAEPYRDPQTGEIIRWFGASVDIHDRRAIEQEREQLLASEQTARETAETANRIKDEFLAVLSHELRSPLNPILGWSKLLQQGKLDAAKTKIALTTIERNAQLQVQLIEDLLDISRIMQGKLSLTATPVSLTEVITAAIETVRLAAEAKQIQITLALDPVASISGDAARLQQVVWNLLTNAVKFTPHRGEVTVELRQVDGLAQMRVVDTGKGINPNFLPYVFEYFRQEDGSTTRKFGGLGLGLAIVRQIVELHGGTVKAESDGEGQGATFTVQLPTLQQASLIASAPIHQAKANLKMRLKNMQILLVDDDTDTREFEAFLLEQHGATVIAVASGLEALQAIERSIPDLIVSDIGMAEIDGYMLIQQIRARPPTQGGQVPAIALTAYAAEIDRQRAMQAGFQRHLTKPLEPEKFISAIVSLLKPK